MAFITDLTARVPTTGTYVNGQPSGIDHRQGSVRGGGTIADSTNFSATTFGEGNPITTIVSGINNTTAITAGAWNSGVQVMSLDQTIAGAANTALQGGSSNSANEAYTPLVLDGMLIQRTTTAIRAGYWNVFSGTWTTPPTQAVLNLWSLGDGVGIAGNFRSVGVDHAGNPTQNEPGEIGIRDGSANPVQTGYQPRNNW